MNADDVNVMLAEHFPGAGANCVELGGTYAVASTELSELSIRPGGYVSGPTQFAIADAALWYVTFVAIGGPETSGSVLRGDRPHRADGAHLRAVDPLPAPRAGGTHLGTSRPGHRHPSFGGRLGVGVDG